MPIDFDYILVGGGLQNSLILLALSHRHPDIRILLIEKADRLGGDHTWSFHETDVPLPSRGWFDPLVSYRWPRYEVRFPNLHRVGRTAYGSIISEQLDRVVRDRVARSPGCRILLETPIADVTAQAVRTASGKVFSAQTVFDGRGAEAPSTGTGYQKFVGWEVELGAGKVPAWPVVMDATGPQLDGHRFLYVLPFTPTRLLMEDTVFSNGSTLDRTNMRRRLLEYAHDQGWQVQRIVREESGVLAMPWRIESRPMDASELGERAVPVGYRGGWFHPATGYSLPVAVRVAQTVADAHASGSVVASLFSLAAEHAHQARFARLLNRLLFLGFAPEDRWNVFERFYRFDEAFIERFYSLRMTAEDRRRLVCGRPPRRFSFSRLIRLHLAQESGADPSLLTTMLVPEEKEAGE